MLVGDSSHLPDIDQGQGRIAGALDPDQFRLVGPDELGHVDLNAGREGHLDAMRRCDFGKVTMSATVDIRDRYDVRALGERLEDQGSCGGA